MAGKFKKVNQAHVNYAIERYAKGASLADIAKCINISRQAVWVEWLMGYSTNWTEINHSVMQWFQNKSKRRLKS